MVLIKGDGETIRTWSFFRMHALNNFPYFFRLYVLFELTVLLFVDFAANLMNKINIVHLLFLSCEERFKVVKRCFVYFLFPLDFLPCHMDFVDLVAYSANLEVVMEKGCVLVPSLDPKTYGFLSKFLLFISILLV